MKNEKGQQRTVASSLTPPLSKAMPAIILYGAKFMSHLESSLRQTKWVHNKLQALGMRA